MYHLPKDGAKVRVFPDPRFKVPVNPPQHGVAPSWMNPSGVLVEWNGLRYRQYLEGLIHFFDPRNKKEQKETDPKDFLHDSTPPQHILDKLKAIALKDGNGAYLEEAKKEEAELFGNVAPQASSPATRGKEKF